MLAVVVCCALWSVGCGSDKGSAVEVIVDANDPRDWGEWGQGGGAVFASAQDEKAARKVGDMIYKRVPLETIDQLDPEKYPPPSLLVYEWSKDGIFSGSTTNVALPQTAAGGVQWLSLHRQYSLRREKKDARGGPVCFMEIHGEDGNSVREYAIPPGWCPRRMDLSENGRFLAIALVPETTNAQSPADYEPFFNNYLQVGLLDCKTGELSWVATINKIQSILVRRIIASNDGKHIVLGSIDHGVTVFDVPAKKHLWSVRPPSALNLNYVAFSPDGKTVYAGGSEGRLYVFDATTGKILRSAWAAANAKSGAAMAGGNRFSCLVVSPDGKYVAGSTDKTYVWNANTLELIRTCRHGRVMGMQFSPNSKKLALVWPGEYLVLEIEK